MISRKSPIERVLGYETGDRVRRSDSRIACDQQASKPSKKSGFVRREYQHTTPTIAGHQDIALAC